MDPTMLPAVNAAKEVKDASANLIVRFLGPSVDVWAEHFKLWNEGLFAKRAENVHRVLTAAERKRGEPLVAAATIHPRVLKEILDDGSFVEDELMADYLGGVLASSLSRVNRDDRGASMAKLVTELSTYEIRLHFIIYRAFKSVFDGSELNIGLATDCAQMELFFPIEPLAAAMDLDISELDDGIAGYCIHGLHRHSLIGPSIGYGEPDALRSIWSEVPSTGPALIASPTGFGASLFMWAHGFGTVSDNLFTDPEVIFDYSALDTPEATGVISTHAPIDSKEMP